MHCLAGLDSLTSGEVYIGDVALSPLPEKQLTLLRRDKVGFIFQAFNLVPTLNAEENITLPLMLARRDPDPAFPARIVQYCVPAFGAAPADDQVVIDRFRELRATNTDKLHYGGIKIVADGSIQGYTAVLRWPGYVTGAPNGLWQVDPRRLPEMVGAYHRAGINVHVHCNGDAVIEAFIDAVDEAVRSYAWLDHRHTVQHCQLTTSAQYRRMATLGMCGNLFANHLWYWGDQHHASTVGPERANRLESAATALDEGVRISLHSDAAVTPLGQLHTMWCAMNRVTPSGRVLGPTERITATRR